MAEIIGSAAIEIKAKDKNFEAEVRKIASKIKKVEVPVDAVVNTDLAKKQLEAFRKAQQGRKVKLYAEVDTRSAATTLNKFIKSYQGKSKNIKLSVDVDTESVLDAATLLDDFKEQYHDSTVDIGVEVDKSVKDDIDDIKRTTDSIGHSLNKDLKLDVNSAGANAQLLATAAIAHATRKAISAPMRMNIDQETLAGIKGFFYTITGGIPIDKVKSTLMGLSANFEGIAVKTGIVSSGVLSMAGTLSHAVGDLLTIGGDVTQVVGLLNAAPAGIAAGGLALTGTILGWKGFGEALMGEGKEAAKAMALLPPEAKKAVKSLDGMGASIRTVTQRSYWKSMGTAVQDVAKVISKDLHTGMSGAGEALGGQMAAMMGSLEEFGKSGGLSNTFDDLNEFFKTSTPALAGFTSGFLDLMEGGAREMPAFGTWLSKLGTGFADWAKEANESGSINIWIQEATQRMKELGKIGQATYGVFSGLTTAARNAGMNGLTDLSKGMVDLSNAMNSKGFQEGLTSFFTATRVGAANALPGVKGFFELIGDGLPTINTAIKDSGIITGNMFKNFTRMFENGNMGKGFLALLDGMKDGTEVLAPGFEHLGNALGGLMEVGGEVIRNVAPGLNQLFETVDVVVNNMKDGIIAALPVFNEFIQGLLAGIRAVVGPLASLAGGMLSAFAGLPGPIQTALMSIGGFLGATALIKNKMKDSTSAVGGFATSAQTGMRRVADTTVNSMKTIGNSLARFNPSISNAFIGPQTLAQANSNMQKLVNANKTSAERIQGIWATADLKREQIDQKAQARRAANKFQSQQVNQTGIGGQILPLTGRNTFDRVSAAAKTASSKAANSLSTIGKTAGVVGGQITRGIGSALGGLTGALGGPWGLALTAGVGAIAAYGVESSKAKERIDGYVQSLNETGEATTVTRDEMAKNLSTNASGFKAFTDNIDAFARGQMGSGKIEEVFKKTGMNATDMATQMMSSKDDFVSAWEEIEKISTETKGNLGQQIASQLAGVDFDPGASGKKLLETGKVTDELLQKAGTTRAEFEKMNGTDLSTMTASIKQVAAETEAADQKAAFYGQTLEKVAKDQIRDNKMILESQRSSVEEKFAAFKSNQQLGGLENLSGQAGFYQLGIVAEQNDSKIKTLNESLAKTGKSLRTTFEVQNAGGQAVAAFDMTTQAGRQMYEVMSSQADAIQRASVSTFDTVLKQSGDVESATTKAMQTATKERDKFVQSLKNNGITDKDTINTLLDTAGLTDQDIEIALRTEGVDQAISDALRVEAALEAYRTGDYTATLNMLDDSVVAKVQEVTGLAENFSNKDFQAQISARFSNQAEYNAWMQDFLTATPEKQIRMLATLEDAGNAQKTLDELMGKGDQLNGKSWTASIETLTKTTGLSPDEIIGKLNTIPDSVIKTLTVETKGSPEEKIQALLTNKEFIAYLTTEVTGNPAAQVTNSLPETLPVSVTPEIGDFTGAIKGAVPESTPVPLAPKLEGSVTSLFGSGPAGLAQTVNVTPKVVEGASINIPDQTVNVNPQVTEGSALNIPDQTANVNLIVNDGGLSDITSSMNSISSKAVSLTVDADPGQVNSIKSALESISSKSVSLTVTTDPAPINSVKNAFNGIKSKSVSLTVKADPTQVNSVKNAFNGIKSKSVSLTASASSSQVNTLKTAMNNVKSKSVKITATAPSTDVKNLKTAIDQVKSKSVSVTASTNTSVVYGLVSAIAAVKSKSVSVTVRTRNITDNADGGMYMGGVKTFARGGFDDPRIAKAIERANRRGGSENHTAQIARGSNNYRVWGEPETGGEAYIPLAMAKRARSLKILEQVAQHFGLTLERFADGGLISGNKVSSNVTTFASGGTTKKTKASAKAKEAEKKRKSDLKELNKTIKESVSDLKKALSTGLSDLKSAFGQGDRSPVQKALDGMRKGVRDFKSETSKQIKEAKKLGKSTKTLTAQNKAAVKVDKNITKQMYSSKVWNRKGSNLQDSRYIAGDARRRQKDRRVDYNSKYTLRDYELAIGHVGKELEKQEDRYKNMVKNHESNLQSISGNLFKQFDLGSLINSKDEFGYRPPTTARDISSYASKMLSDMKKFNSNLGALRRAGYNEAIINQISQMGLEEAIVVSQALLADKSQMKSINSSFTQMFGKNGDMNIASDGSTYVGGLANSIGKATADKMFKAGVDIQKGLVNGLTADVKALEKAGQTMSDALVKSFKKALKIKSPSRVFMALGKFIPQGLTAGIDSGQGIVDSSISSLVQPKKLNLTAPGSRTTNSSGIINGNGGTNPVTVNVYPSEGMSERQIGTTAAREIHYRLDSF